MSLKRIKVGIFGTKGIGNYGGFESFVKKFIELNDFFEVYVSFPDTNLTRDYECTNYDNNCKLIKQKPSKLRYISYNASNIFDETRIYRDLRKIGLNLDIVIQCGSTPGFFLNKRWLDNTLLLVNPDGLEWKRKKFPWYGRYFLYLTSIEAIRKSNGVILDNKSLFKDFKNMLYEKVVYYAPYGTQVLDGKNLDKNVLHEFGLVPGEYYIFVGRCVPENNLLDIVRWFSTFPTNKQLLVVTNLGKDKYSKLVIDSIKTSRGKVITSGPVYDQEKLAVLRFFAYAYIHGHSVGGTNPSLLEALGAGNASVCYDVSYNREVAGASAKYFSDRETFFEALWELEHREEVLNTMRQTAINIAKGRYSWDFVVELYKMILLHNLLLNKRVSQKQYLDVLYGSKYRERLLSYGYGDLNKRNFIDQVE